jgi:hypothetical protein
MIDGANSFFEVIDSEPGKRALVNLKTSIRPGCQFPENVFRGRWDEFFFFDSDLLFNSKFVDTAKALLEAEKGSCICLCNLDEASAKDGRERACIGIDKRTSSEAYFSFLRGPSVGKGWLYRMEVFGCTSDVGSWCIYCEKGTEIAVIAVRDGSPTVIHVITKFGALPLRKAIEKPTSYGLTPRALSPELRAKYLREYGKEIEAADNG